MKKVPEKWKKILDEMYEKEPYLLARYSSTELAKKLHISSPYMRGILSYYGYSFKKDVEKLLKDYNPKKYTYDEIKRITKIKTNRFILNKYAKKMYGNSFIHIKDKEFIELKEEFQEMLDDVKYPMLKLKIKGIIKYLGLTKRQFNTFRKKIDYDFSKKNEVRRMFKEYNLSTFTPQEIAFDLGVNVKNIYSWIKTYKTVGKQNIRPVSLKKIKAENDRYGELSSERKMSLKDVKYFFENELRTKGYVYTKDLRSLGYKSFAKWLYEIKKRYGININYKYNKKELKYELTS